MTQDKSRRAPLARGEIRAGADLTFNTPDGANMALVAGEEETPLRAAQLLAALRGALRQYVPGGGEQYLDRYLAAVREESVTYTRDPDAAPFPAADEALRLIQKTCELAEWQQAGGDTYTAAGTLATGMGKLAELLAPYAEAMPKTVIIMRNGNSLQVATSTNTAADIAGLMNAGTPKVYNAVDVNDGRMHYIAVAEIQDVYETP